MNAASATSRGARRPERWAPSARLIYLTGGTTRRPREVSYDDPRYRLSVRVTGEILAAHGVAPTTRVVVCHPFDPWAIGAVFRDAALSCGATVLPLGLTMGQPAAQGLVSEFRPDVVCGPASLLARSAGAVPPTTSRRGAPTRTVFHAGEPITPAIRAACGTLWQARVVDVFGMAEFDSVAGEGVRTAGLILSPHLRYALGGRAGRRRALAPGRAGELLIRRRADDAWYATRDRIRVQSPAPADEPLWPGSWVIEHLGRLDVVLKLPDGSTVAADHVLAATRRVAGLEQLQLRLRRRRTGPSSLTVLAVGHDVVRGDVRTALLETCLELADAVIHEVVTVEVVEASPADLERSPRGKVKPFVEVQE